VARMEDRKGEYRERGHLEDLGRDGRIMLKWIFKQWDGRHGPDCCGTGQGQVAGACERGNEPFRSIKCGEFLYKLRTC
jgi:hypothetical protein